LEIAGWLMSNGAAKVLDRCLALGETGQDRPPGRVGKGGERRAEVVGLLHVYHQLVI